MMPKVSRREFLKDCSFAAAGSLMAGAAAAHPDDFSGRERIRLPNEAIIVDPRPQFPLSPYFYMQFMEPLGNTDGSVEASWDYDTDDWRDDLIETVGGLAPDCIRWGGAFIRYYKWREGVGPPESRPSMYNYIWGGKESNRVGTAEVVSFCRRVGAEPLICVNLLSDGVKAYWKTRHGENRRGDAREAADWVSYANDPSSAERRAHGHPEPFRIKLWQLGNETSYLYEDGFSVDETASHSLEFAAAMKERDPSIEIIGWGDVRNPEKLRPETPGDDPDVQFWAARILERAGDYLDHIAMHMMGIYPRDGDRLNGFEFLKEPEEAWSILLRLSDIAGFRIRAMKDVLQSAGARQGIAITEGHLSLRPYNTAPVLTTWLSAAYHARTMNTYLRHGDRVKICTGADFCGTRWTVNAVMMPVPRGESFLLPVGSIMKLYKKFKGRNGVGVDSVPGDLDVAATRTGDRFYLHVLNTSYTRSVKASLAVRGMTIVKAQIHEIAPPDPLEYVNQNRPDVFTPSTKAVPPDDPLTWTFPPTSVSVAELEVKERRSG
jgi:alpha-L-arabinofuranosidase